MRSLHFGHSTLPLDEQKRIQKEFDPSSKSTSPSSSPDVSLSQFMGSQCASEKPGWSPDRCVDLLQYDFPNETLSDCSMLSEGNYTQEEDLSTPNETQMAEFDFDNHLPGTQLKCEARKEAEFNFFYPPYCDKDNFALQPLDHFRQLFEGKEPSEMTPEPGPGRPFVPWRYLGDLVKTRVEDSEKQTNFTSHHFNRKGAISNIGKPER